MVGTRIHKEADVLGNHRKNWRRKERFNVLHLLYARIEILDKKCETHPRDEPENNGQG